MIDKNNIPQGYKNSPIGIIPQEWEVKKLKDISKVLTGSTPSTTDLSNYGSDYMFVSPVDMSENKKYIYKTEKMLSRKGYSISRKMPIGSVLYTCIGSTIGKIGIASSELTSNQQINAIICNEDNEFLYYVLLYNTGRIRKLAGEQAVPIIKKSDFENLNFPIPPLAEQKKIAEILCTWDDAIEKQSKLIEKLELRKRGLMQRLLTGKIRLPGFTEPWKKIKLGEIGTFLSTNTLSRDKLNSNEGTIKNIHYGDILIKYAEIVNVSSVEIPFINKGVVVSSEYIENGDIVFADTAEDYTVGKAIEIINVNGNKIVAGLHTMLFRPRTNIFVECYLGYYINSEYYQCQLLPLTQGIKVCSITKKGISQTKVLVPEKSEQKAIASVLSAADKEIETQRKKLEALRQQKRGLMQQLLTGKTRVKVA